MFKDIRRCQQEVACFETGRDLGLEEVDGDAVVLQTVDFEPARVHCLDRLG